MDELAAIYDAIGDDEVFARLGELISPLAGARSCTLQVFAPDESLREFSSNHFSKEMFDRYVDLELYRLDVWRAPSSRVENLNRIVAMDNDVPLDRFLRSAFYNENFRWWGDDTAYCISGRVNFEGGHAGIGLHRGLGGKPFTTEEIASVQVIVPHLRRMFELRARLGAVDLKARLSEAALDSHAHAVFITDSAGRPSQMNAAAQTLVQRADPLLLTKVGLRTIEDETSRALTAAIGLACARTGAMGGALSVPRREGSPLRVLISPLRVGHHTRALIIVDEPGRIDPEHAANMRGYYGLSQAEAETVAALAQGLSPLDVARSRGVSLPTIRTQVRHALHKMEARGIPELVALAASAPRRRVD